MKPMRHVENLKTDAPNSLGIWMGKNVTIVIHKTGDGIRTSLSIYFLQFTQSSGKRKGQVGKNVERLLAILYE